MNENQIILSDTEDGNNDIEIGTGVYASEVLVKEITNFSNHPNYPEKKVSKNGFEYEICIVVKYDTGLGFDKQIYLMGKYITDKVTGKVTGWISRGNAVQRFLVKVLGNKARINADGTIPEQTLKACIGASFIVVRYVDGWYKDKPSYATWDKVFRNDATLEEIQGEWLNSVKYLKKYSPSIIQEYEEKKLAKDANFDANKFESVEI